MHYPLTQLWLDIFTPGLTVNLTIPYTEANQQIGLVTGPYEVASVHITDENKPREDVKVRVFRKHPHGVGLFDIPAHDLLNMAWDDHAVRRVHYTAIKALWKKHKESYVTPDHSQTGNFDIKPPAESPDVIVSKARQVGLSQADAELWVLTKSRLPGSSLENVLTLAEFHMAQAGKPEPVSVVCLDNKIIWTDPGKSDKTATSRLRYNVPCLFDFGQWDNPEKVETSLERAIRMFPQHKRLWVRVDNHQLRNVWVPAVVIGKPREFAGGIKFDCRVDMKNARAQGLALSSPDLTVSTMDTVSDTFFPTNPNPAWERIEASLLHELDKPSEPVKVPAEDLKVYEAMQKSVVENEFTPVVILEGGYSHIREGDVVEVIPSAIFIAVFGGEGIDHGLRHRVVSREDRSGVPGFHVQQMQYELRVDEPLTPPTWMPAGRLKAGNCATAMAWTARRLWPLTEATFS